MRNLTKTITTLFTLVILIAGTSDVFGGKTGSFDLNVRVLPSFEYNMLKDSAGFEVTEADIANGFKDITGAAVISVSTNSRKGYMMSVCKQQADEFGPVVVSTDSTSLNLPAYGCMEIFETAEGIITDNVTNISYRVYFSPDTKAGYYPSLLAVSAYPL